MRTTSYDKIYNRFLAKIRDYPFLEKLNEGEAGEEFVRSVLHDYLTSAIANFTYSLKVLEDRDEVGELFNFHLTELEIEIISKFMLVAYLTPSIISSDKLEQKLSSKDYAVFSSANLINQISEVRTLEFDQATMLMVENYYRGAF